MRIEQRRCLAIAPRRAAHAQVDATWSQCFENPELLGHFVGAVMRQHDTCTAQPDALSARGDSCEQNFWRTACDTRHGMVFADPIALIAQRFAMLCQGKAFSNRCILGPAGEAWRLVEYRQPEL